MSDVDLFGKTKLGCNKRGSQGYINRVIYGKIANFWGPSQVQILSELAKI